MYKIKAIAPTSYQLQSLREFGMPIKKLGNGSHVASAEFETEDEAKEYLKGRADQYNGDDPEGSEGRLDDMYRDIEHGQLTLDAATARIEEVYEEE